MVQERRKKEREVEEKRLAAERAAEDERRKAAEVNHILILQHSIANIVVFFVTVALFSVHSAHLWQINYLKFVRIVSANTCLQNDLLCTV